MDATSDVTRTEDPQQSKWKSSKTTERQFFQNYDEFFEKTKVEIKMIFKKNLSVI